MIPPRLVRRAVITPAVLLLAAASWGVSPALLLGAWLADPRPGHGQRPLRTGVFALAYLGYEAVGVGRLVVLWARYGARLHGQPAQERHEELLRWFLDRLYDVSERVLDLHVDAAPGSVDPDELLARDRPLLVLSRHDGPGDTFLLVQHLLSYYHRRPRIVMKDTLQIDPCLDLIGHRLPHRFIHPAGGRRPDVVAEHPGPGQVSVAQVDAGDMAADAVADLARGLHGRDALLLFPEGGNATSERRRRGIRELRRRGWRAEAKQAEGLRHLIAPRPRGAQHALAANPRLDVLLVAHSGLTPGSHSARRLLLPVHTRLHVRTWLVPRADVPDDPDEQAGWLLDQWERLDGWVHVHPTDAAADAR